MKGPAGSGKTTTVSLLSQALNFQLLTWHNPTVSEAGTAASIAAQFDDFISRSGRFGSLGFVTVGSDQAETSSGNHSLAPRRVMMIEEFPSTISRSSTALESFRGVLLRYLAIGSTNKAPFGGVQPSADRLPPVIMVISESLLTSATSSTDSFTAHRLLGAELIHHPLVTNIDFNTVAPSFVAKALDLVIKKEARKSQRRKVPGPAVLKRLSEMGDLRSAVNSLEFLCTRNGENDDWSGRVAAKLKRPNKDGVPLTTMEKDSLSMIAQREASLGIFHAVGKVVYNKREDPTVSIPPSEPLQESPDHLSHLHKPKISQVDIDDLMNETGTDIPTFLSTLHENFVLSCNGDLFLESFELCSEWLSESDILCPDSGTRPFISYGNANTFKGVAYAGGLDMLRQTELSFQLAVRGLLFDLPYPVHRASHPRGNRGDSFKMFYPASLRLWKPMEEIGDLISLLLDQTSFAGPYRPSRDVDNVNKDNGGVASWRHRNMSFATVSPGKDISDEIPRVPVSRGDMLYDRLPYLGIIGAKRDTGLDLSKVRQITQFRGLPMRQQQSAGEEDDVSFGAEGAGLESSAANYFAAADETTDDRVAPGAVRTKRDRIIALAGAANAAAAAAAVAVNAPTASRLGVDNSRVGGGSTTNTAGSNEVQLEKLYISDDDIQDD